MSAGRPLVILTEEGEEHFEKLLRRMKNAIRAVKSTRAEYRVAVEDAKEALEDAAEGQGWHVLTASPKFEEAREAYEELHDVLKGER